MAFDAFLKIDGVDGESTDSKHKGEIDILSFDWEFSSPTATGKPTFQTFHFISPVQKSSPVLFSRSVTRLKMRSALLTLRSAGGAEFVKLTLEDVVVRSFKQLGTADGPDATPTEDIALGFAKFRFECASLKGDGSLGTFIAGTWP